MYYYVFKNGSGEPVNTYASEDMMAGTNIEQLTEAEYKAYNIDAQREIFELKEKLAGTDYAVIKIAEGAATAEDYAEIIAKRGAWRKRINELGG